MAIITGATLVTVTTRRTTKTVTEAGERRAAICRRPALLRLVTTSTLAEGGVADDTSTTGTGIVRGTTIGETGIETGIVVDVGALIETGITLRLATSTTTTRKVGGDMVTMATTGTIEEDMADIVVGVVVGVATEEDTGDTRNQEVGIARDVEVYDVVLVMKECIGSILTVFLVWKQSIFLETFL